MTKTFFRTLSLTLLSLGSILNGLASVASAQNATPLTAQKPIVVPGGAGGYDWMAVDTGMNRVLAGHKGKGTLVVMDLKSSEITSVPVGGAQGIAVDSKNDKYFVGDADEKKVVVLERKTLKTVAELPVTGPVDAVALDPKRGMVYADCDDGKEVWVIDAKTNKMVATVAIAAEGPEWVEYDPATDRMYQNVKTNNTVAVIDPDKHKVVKVFNTAPATGPHGLVVANADGKLFTAGNNGKLVVMNAKTGKVLSTIPIGTGVDQIAYDPGMKRIYCACRGVISVVEVTPNGGKLLANVPQPAGAHTIAVDPATHTVWVCYADKTDSYLQAFTP